MNATSALILLQQGRLHLNREAILENRAAIDYSLLKASHGCEDFEGCCCLKSHR